MYKRGEMWEVRATFSLKCAKIEGQEREGSAKERERARKSTKERERARRNAKGVQ